MTRLIWKFLIAMALAMGAVGGNAEPIRVGDSSVVFEAPRGLAPLPQALIDIKWPGNRAPRFVVGNERGTTTVAYDLKPHKIPIDRLSEVKDSFVGQMGRVVPGIRWISKEIIELDGQPWIFLEMTSTAIDTDIHNIMLITGLKDEMLIFNFNSTKEEFPKVEAALRESMRSIRMGR